MRCKRSRTRCAIVAFMSMMLLLSMSCQTTSNEKQRAVSVTILPQQYLAEQIAGDRFTINCVVPANSSPEAYDPTPRQLMAVEESDAYMQVGMLGFELAWIDKLAQNNPAMKLYNTSEGVDMIEGLHEHRHADGSVHAATTVDPHVWCSPRNVRVMARNMYDAFVELDADGKSYYERNYYQLLHRIDSVENLVHSILSPCRGTAFAIFHPSLTYLARDYGLTQLCLEEMGKESSAMAMKNIIDEARNRQVKVVFVQREFNSRQVETFAHELGLEIVTINPLNYHWEEEIVKIAYAIAQQ